MVRLPAPLIQRKCPWCRRYVAHSRAWGKVPAASTGVSLKIVHNRDNIRGMKIPHPLAVVAALTSLAAGSLLTLSSDPAEAAETGRAAYYRGGRTASGEMSGPHGYTAAHRTLPFGTRVVVTNVGNGRSVTVRINDRGPFGRGRLIDVSMAAARDLGMLGSGTAMVRIDPQ